MATLPIHTKIENQSCSRSRATNPVRIRGRAMSERPESTLVRNRPSRPTGRLCMVFTCRGTKR